MLVGLDNKPLPPQDILDRLRKMDESLGMQWVGPPTNQWGITLRWSQNDARREMIQKGRMSPGDDYDLVAFLPDGCTSDDAPGYIERCFVRWGGTKKEINWLLDRLHLMNDAQHQNALKAVEELGEELITTNAKTLFPGKHIPRTKAPKGKIDSDSKRLKEFLRDS